MNCLLCARPGCELEELTFTPAISQVGPRGVLGPNPHCCCSLQFSSWGQILGDPQELFFSQGACGQRRAAEPWAKRPHRSELEGEHLRGRSPLLLGTSLLLPAPVALIPSAPTSHPPDTQADSVFPGPGAGGELRSSFGTDLGMEGARLSCIEVPQTGKQVTRLRLKIRGRGPQKPSVLWGERTSVRFWTRASLPCDFQKRPGGQGPVGPGLSSST